MEISATVTTSASAHEAVVRTGTASQTLSVPAKVTGRGFAVNGGQGQATTVKPSRMLSSVQFQSSSGGCRIRDLSYLSYKPSAGPYGGKGHVAGPHCVGPGCRAGILP